jgi:hypothetical protein
MRLFSLSKRRLDRWIDRFWETYDFPAVMICLLVAMFFFVLFVGIAKAVVGVD